MKTCKRCKRCKRCSREYRTKYKLCDICRAKNREYETRRRAGGGKIERAPQEIRQRPTRVIKCKHAEWFNYGEGVYVCADCGQVDRRNEVGELV